MLARLGYGADDGGALDGAQLAQLLVKLVASPRGHRYLFHSVPSDRICPAQVWRPFNTQIQRKYLANAPAMGRGVEIPSGHRGRFRFLLQVPPAIIRKTPANRTPDRSQTGLSVAFRLPDRILHAGVWRRTRARGWGRNHVRDHPQIDGLRRCHRRGWPGAFGGDPAEADRPGLSVVVLEKAPRSARISCRARCWTPRASTS